MNAKMVLYMINPCHMTLLLQAYCFWAPYSLRSQFIFTLMLRFLMGGLAATLFPDSAGLD